MSSFNYKLAAALSENVYKDIEDALEDVESGNYGDDRRKATKRLDEIDLEIKNLYDRGGNFSKTEELDERSRKAREAKNKNSLLPGSPRRKLRDRRRITGPKDLAGDMLGQLMDS